MPNTVPAAATGLPAETFVDPARLPERYATVCVGACMAPKIPDGSYLAVSAVEPCKPGDLVVLYFRPELVKPGHPQGLIKRLVMAPPPWIKFPMREQPQSEVKAILLVEMDNPRQQLIVRCDQLLGIHKCLGVIPKETTRSDLTSAEKDAVAYRADRIQAPRPSSRRHTYA